MLLLTFGPIVLLLSIFTNGQRMCENPSRFDWQEVENQDDFYVSSSMSTSYSKWKEQFKALENNEFAITDHIPNPICAAVAETDSSTCHEVDTLLPKWYLSMKCILACNATMGLARSDISKTEVYCDFSRNNTLEQPVGSAEWGASCYCPSNSKLAQLTVNIPYVTLTEMLDEYNRLFCHDINAIEETIFLFEYNKKEFTDCNEVPNICDKNARCQRKNDQEWFMCVCNDGYIGDGFDCRRTCIVKLGDGIRPIIKFNGELLRDGEAIMEGDIVEVKCIILEQFQQNATCACDGEIRPLPVCKRAIYIIGGSVPDLPYNVEPIGVFIPDDVASSKIIMTARDEYHQYNVLAFNYKNELYTVGWDDFTVERFDKITNSWKLQRYAEMYDNNSGFGILVGSKYYKCGHDGCQYLDILKNEWIDRAVMMVPRIRGCSFLLRGLWYLVGGSTKDTSQITDLVEVYNFVSDTFQTAANYPTEVYGCAAASLYNIGYVCGGKSLNTYLKKCYAFSTSANSWTQITSMEKPRKFASLVESGGVLFALLGYYREAGKYQYPGVEKYDPDTDQWEILPGVADKIGKRYRFAIA